jgi:hypothetical protein
MICMWFTGINYYKLAVEKDRDSIFTTIWDLYGKQGRRNQRLDTIKMCHSAKIMSEIFL